MRRGLSRQWLPRRGRKDRVRAHEHPLQDTCKQNWATLRCRARRTSACRTLSRKKIIRYELHVFRKETKAAYDTTHPHLSATYAVGMRGHDGAQASEWSLLYGAM